MTTPDIIYAPFTPEQVRHLNNTQAGTFLAPILHPFTCNHRGDARHAPVNSVTDVLIATPAGWICPYCGATQDWAYRVMAEAVPDKMAVAMANALGDTLTAVSLERIDAAMTAYRDLQDATALNSNVSDAISGMLACLQHSRERLGQTDPQPPIHRISQYDF